MIIKSTPYLFDFNEITNLDTEIMEIFRKSTEILEKFPEIRECADFDLERYALKKKELRLSVKKYNEEQINGKDYLFDCFEINNGTVIQLESGRPRLRTELVVFFMILRGLWSSISDHRAAETIKDSLSINSVLAYYNYKIPGINTIRENINAVSNSTRRLIMKSQAMLILMKGLDDFSEVYIDSTDTSANTSYPTDVSILYKLIDRVYRSFLLLEKEFDFPCLGDGWLHKRLENMNGHLAFISMNVGKGGVKGKVKESFKAFAVLGQNCINSFFEEQERLTVNWESSQLPPDKGIALDTLWYKIDEDLHDALYVLYYAELLVHENIRLPSREKILSISDCDAAYIQKGQRYPTIGYKPQIARSGNGFICGYLLPAGNTADSEMLLPTVLNVYQTTNIMPLLVSTDDGYASEKAVRVLKEECRIPTVSINGSKGKKLTLENWDTTSYAEARRKRSAVESSMFTLKYRHGFGRMRRRGIEAVEAEQLEKVIAYNFLHMIKKEKTAIKNAA